MAKIRYTYIIEVTEDRVDDILLSVRSSLAQPTTSEDRAIIPPILGQIIPQMQRMMQTQVGAAGPCSKIIQHCCLLGMGVTGTGFHFEVEPVITPIIPPSRQINWEDPT